MSTFLDPISKPSVELLKPKIIKRFKEGRGNGEGKTYKPFLEVRDVPSSGRIHRLPSITHGRIVHLLSDLELAAFLLFDWSSNVIDIREQFPLDPNRTFELSQTCQISHPAFRGDYQVMTTDFVIDIDINGKIHTQAISVKYSTDLKNKRVIEKQELERRYWESKEIEWFIFTENEVPNILIQNIKWVLPHIHSFELNKNDRHIIFEDINYALQTYPVSKIAKSMALLDENKHQKAGTHLQYFRHLLAQRAFAWDMSKIKHSSLTTNQIKANENWLIMEEAYVSAE